jgi:hypothetical protein
LREKEKSVEGHWKNLRMKSFGKDEVSGEGRLLDCLHKSGNVEGRRMRRVSKITKL